VKRDRPLPKQSDGQAPLEKLLKLDYSFLCYCQCRINRYGMQANSKED